MPSKGASACLRTVPVLPHTWPPLLIDSGLGSTMHSLQQAVQTYWHVLQSLLCHKVHAMMLIDSLHEGAQQTGT